MNVQPDAVVGSAASQANGPEATRKVEHGGPSRTSPSKSGDSSDRVELSSLAGRIASAHATFSAERSARIGALAEAYRSGSYQPDIGSLSKKLADQWQSSGGKVE